MPIGAEVTMNEQLPPEAERKYPENKPLSSANRESAEADRHSWSTNWEAYSLPILAALLDP